MAAFNYDELCEAIAQYARRDGDPEFPVDDFIALAEADFRALIRHYLSEKTVTLEGVTDRVEFPSDLVEPRLLRIGTVTPRQVSPYSSAVYPGQIGYVQEGNGYRLIRQSYDPVDALLTYNASVLALTSDNPTNWLITRFPQVYLSGALVYAYRWLDDVEAEQLAKQSLAEALGRLDEDNRRVARGGNAIIAEGTVW